MLIDYGYLIPKNKSTLQSVMKNKKNNLLKKFRKSRYYISCKFQTFKRIFLKKNLKVKKIVSQKFFLEKMGIIERAKILEKNMKFKRKIKHYFKVKKAFK